MYQRAEICKRIGITAVLMAGVFAPLLAESARTLVGQGNQQYKEQRYKEALGSYEKAEKAKPDSSHVLFNKGNALYMQGDYPRARDAYENAAVRSHDAELEARSKFNQGNAAFRQGVTEAQMNPDQAIDSIGKGVRSYQDALKMNPKLDDARHNVEVARRFIQQLREEMKKQPPQPDQNKQNQDKNQQQQQQQQSEQDEKQKEQQQQQQQGGENNEQQQAQQRQQQQQNSRQPIGAKMSRNRPKAPRTSSTKSVRIAAGATFKPELASGLWIRIGRNAALAGNCSGCAVHLLLARSRAGTVSADGGGEATGFRR